MTPQKKVGLYIFASEASLKNILYWASFGKSKLLNGGTLANPNKNEKRENLQLAKNVKL